MFPRAVLLLMILVTPAMAADGDEHLLLGNPSGATADRLKPNNYLMVRPHYALAYDSSKGTPRWVSWQLTKKWLGSARRGNAFAPDTRLPKGFMVVRPDDFRGSGFDRGHLCPAGDRSARKEDMIATFLMSNMIPQSPSVNRGLWAKMEDYCRDQVRNRGLDLYLVAGPAGQGGVGSDGPRKTLRGARGAIVVPSRCWKVVLAVPAGADPLKVPADQARVFAVSVPNVQGTTGGWRECAVTVDEVEKLTGLSFFDKLPRAVAAELKARKPQTRDARKAGLELAAFEKGCVIGNRRSNIYHLPGGRYYESMQSSANAVYFKTEADARKAGYRKSKT